LQKNDYILNIAVPKQGASGSGALFLVVATPSMPACKPSQQLLPDVAMGIFPFVLLASHIT